MAGPDFWIYSVLAAIIHEAAHVAIAWTHGVKIKRVGISWRGPFIVREQGEPTQTQELPLPALSPICFWRWHAGMCCPSLHR
jgi:hypothetical protein